MTYRALYRKYRPRTFDGVIGQSHITTILKNQVASGHVSHAYLFCGTRGTGKTSTAKIFARAVNCLSPVDGSPCGKCAACAVSEDANLDIVEMDAASNTGVDNMRVLMDKASFMPLELNTKVYIIDESHMLTNQAFNALLKTLEEPPPHVMFIFATTEPHKMPATIISRCQRFDFRRISVTDMVACIKGILTDAGASIDEEGLLAIARASDGSMRDALSLADQCLSFCGNDVKSDMVYSVLGSADDSLMFSIADALIESNASRALRLLQELAAAGRDFGVFIRDLCAHMRCLLMAKLCGSCADILDCTEEAMRAYIKQADSISQERILRAIDLLTETERDMRWLTLPRVVIESALVRICCPETDKAIDGLADRLNDIEKRLKNGAISVSSPSAAPARDIHASKHSAEKAPQKRKKPVISDNEEKRSKELFSALQAELRANDPTLWAIMSQMQRLEISGSMLTVYFSNTTYPEQLNSPKSRAAINRALAQIDDSMELVITSETEDDDCSWLEDTLGIPVTREE